ncbi:MAG: hypothetical protein R3C68_15575 [Myxococcota bacterium]
MEKLPPSIGKSASVPTSPLTGIRPTTLARVVQRTDNMQVAAQTDSAPNVAASDSAVGQAFDWFMTLHTI